jgi:hypothetical protein
MSNKPRTQNAHESGEDQQIRPPLVECGRNRAIEIFAIAIEAMFDARGRNAHVFCTDQPVRIRAIAENDT